KGTDEEILATELANLEVLLANNKNISNLSGIEYCINLIELDLSNNQVVDISKLNTLTDLEILNLRNNNIVNIYAISRLVNLTWLDLQDNDIGDIWPLANNPGLGMGDRVLLAGNGILIVEHTGPWDVVSELEDRGVELHTVYSW
ncbi:MAG: leucine-rich repeat domain-containing protein, partial [Dehalococcoidia bacterium]